MASDGTQSNGLSFSPSMSTDGRYVAFDSWASNLVAGDTNAFPDVFVHDCQTGVTQRVSVASDGAQANDVCCAGPISADGRYVTFWTRARNLVPGDSSAAMSIFVHDRQTGQTEVVSVATGGYRAWRDSYLPAINADGRYVAFTSDDFELAPGDIYRKCNVFVRDRQTGQTERVSVASDGTPGIEGSSMPTISADGRCVAFVSFAWNLVPGDTNNALDIFVHDRQTGQTERVSEASSGAQGNNQSCYSMISGDGRYVAFMSCASNLVSGDTNQVTDIFVRDRQTGQTERVSVSSGGAPGNAASYAPVISGDGRYVGFISDASNLVPGDDNGCADMFVRDRQTAQTQRVSLANDGAQGNGHSFSPAISPDGRYVAFQSAASNLISDDTNGVEDVFVRDWQGTAFSGTPSKGKAPLAVAFRDLSTSSPTSWLWDFGDGTTSTDQNPSHQYQRPGAYTVTLTGSDRAGSDTMVKERYIKNSFTDVAISPLDPADYWALNQILACVDASVVGGYEDGTYRPTQEVTRDQMAVFVSRALAGGDAYVPSGPASSDFDDVPTDHWAYKYVEYVYANNIVAGYASRTYGPNIPVDRGQMAVFIARSLVVPSGDAGVPDPVGDPTFPDVTPTNSWAWCYKHVEFIADRGITRGYEDRKYHPEYICSRDQMAVYVQRAFGLPT